MAEQDQSKGMSPRDFPDWNFNHHSEAYGLPDRLWLRIPFWILVLALTWQAGRFIYNLFVPWRPLAIAEVPFLAHAETQVSGKIRVTAAALAPLVRSRNDYEFR